MLASRYVDAVFSGLALDWVVGTLYWTDSTNAHIKMSRKDGRFQQVLIEKGVNNPLGIAVHPGRGYAVVPA